MQDMQGGDMKRLMTIALAASIGLVGCGDAEVDEVPEIGEVEGNP